ncbi:hypothetical protein SAMN02745664_12415 [Moraxella cuniculi DSM 21768]|uniref:Uncharacterized protein n=1 Tax=Moraxella cuniculi DSM 21768 TaxID=1122245 RepID=A0A1N7G6L7_9GAMM|nr:hypothetical protein [Moraxella cuniculi]OOS04356.1 hypothetical protein B0189_08575 [Moraxella cuniculi]SIS08211.1 hypothetical protein SAMN02745664_12415 [Moraxella cuniculi DSM 21768]
MTVSENQPIPKSATVARILRDLRQMRLSTEHGRRVKSNTIAHLLAYETSIRSGHAIDVGALGATVIGITWLCNHIMQIDDKRVLPSQRLALADALAYCQARYDIEKTI